MPPIVIFIAFFLVVVLSSDLRKKRRKAGKSPDEYGYSRLHPYGRPHTPSNNHGVSRNQRAVPGQNRIVVTHRDEKTPSGGIMRTSSITVVRDPVGESHAAPIPEPHGSPLVGAVTPAIEHAQEHLEPTLPPADFPQHPSEAALHADAHIATTPAHPTPKTTTAQRLAFELPKNQDSLKKALLYSEIFGKPKALKR